MEIRELGKKVKNTMAEEDKQKLLKEMRKKDEKLVNGMFEFIDAQGGFLEFAYRKYSGEPIMMIKLIHGEICELPMGIIKHLNNTKKKVRRYSQELPTNGRMTPRSFETISRVRFTPMEMM